jgi:hypothetical protein
MTHFRKVLGLRATGILLLGFGIPAVAMVAVRLLQHPWVQALSGGHEAAWLGVLDAVLRSLADLWRTSYWLYALAAAAGVFLLRAEPRRLVRLWARMEQ